MFLVNGCTLHSSATVKAFSSISNYFWTTHRGCVLQCTMFERFSEALFSVWVLFNSLYNNSKIYFLNILSQFPKTIMKCNFKNTPSFLLYE